jgi:hypothetical protein
MKHSLFIIHHINKLRFGFKITPILRTFGLVDAATERTEGDAWYRLT